MSEAQGLERSFLEAKKADELRAIAKAAGVAISGRPTKSGVIDQIMKAAGGTVSDTSTQTSTEERPKRARTARSRSTKPQAEAQTPLPIDGVSEPSQGASSGDTASSAPVAKPESASGNGSSGSKEMSERPSEKPGEGERAQGAAPSAESSARDSQSTDSSPTGEGRESREPRDREPRGDREPREGRGRERGGRSRDRGDRPGFGAYADAEGGNSRSSRRRRGRNRNRDERVAVNTEAADAAFTGEPEAVSGILELNDQGFGFLRTKNFQISSGDVYVPVSQVRKYSLRKGDYNEGQSRPAASNEKYPALLGVDKVGGLDPDVARQRPRFEDLTPLFPDSKLALEIPGDKANMTARIVDLLSPIGKGQRGLIVSPPKAGKTTVMKQIAHSIEANNPDVHVMVLLIDERPEEVTDMRRTVRGEVIASTFDRPADEHTRVTEVALERAKRLVEMGQDVVIILDGITRLARAYNLAAPASGRIMSGGVDSGALYPPKRFFGAARNIEEGGSLTILATALVETGSKMDEVIFEEFKGTGNMELRLDRRLAERRLYPAIDVNGSSTRHEELLFDRTQLNQVWKLRRVLNALAQDGSTAAGLELLMDKIKSTGSNDEFLAEIAKTPVPGS